MQTIKLLNCPSSIRDYINFFVKQSFHNLVVKARKEGNKYIVMKDEILQKLRERGFGFKDTADYLQDTNNESFVFEVTEVEEVRN